MSISQNFPATRPSLNINFARSQKLDPRITFTRTSSATRVNSDGLIEVVPANSPRFDFDPISGECLGLLIEEQRTNLFQHNDDPALAFSGTATKTTVQIVLPSGETGPAMETDANAFAENYENFSATSNTSPGYLTFYAKKKSAGSIGTLTITMEGGGTPRSFNSASINSDTWTKISTTHDWSSSNSTLRRYDIYLQTANSSDGDTSFYMAFQQFEEATFPTSYIPTSGSTATRTPDNASITGSNFSDFFNPNEGTVYSDTKINGVQTGRFDRLWAITNSNLNQDGLGLFISGPSGTFGIYDITATIGGVTQYPEAGGTLSTSGMGIIASSTPRLKSCFGFTTGNTNISYNGRLPNSSGVTITNLLTADRLLIGQPQRFQGHSCMTISQLTYYPVRLPNQILQNLTK